MYFLKNFNNHSEYEAFVSGGTMELPNISRCITQTEIHYNPREVDPYNGHAYVDFNLPSGTIWAKNNVGATNEYDNGLFYAWGETTGYVPAQVTGSSTPHKDFNVFDYQFFDVDLEHQTLTITKYNTNSDFGSVDDLTRLETTDDAARVNMGGLWRMPTAEEIEELINETLTAPVIANTITYWDDNVGDYVTITTNKFNGNTGLLFYLNTTTPDVALANDEYLFFPMAGLLGDGEEYGVESESTILSSDLDPEIPYCVSGLVLNVTDYETFNVNLTSSERFGGMSVRGVVGGTPLPYIVSVNGYEWEQGGRLYFDTLKEFTIIVSTPISGSATMLVDYRDTQQNVEHYEVPLTISNDGLTLTGSLSQTLDNNSHNTSITVSHYRGLTNTFIFIGIYK